MWSVRTHLRESIPFHDRESCNVCHKSQDFTIEVEQDYALIYGLRFFPLKQKIFSICSHCQRRKKISLTEKNGTPDPRFLNIRPVPYSTFMYYTGWIILVLLAAGTFYLYKKYFAE